MGKLGGPCRLFCCQHSPMVPPSPMSTVSMGAGVTTVRFRSVGTTDKGSDTRDGPTAPAGETLAVPRSDSRGGSQWGTLAIWWLASLLVAVVHNGLWATPNLAFMSQIASNIGDNPFPAEIGGDYLLTGPLPGVLAALMGQTDPHEVARLGLILLVLGWGLVVVLANHHHGFRVARTLTVLLAAAPLVTVSMQWLGQPDPITGLCGVAMVLVRRRWSLFALAVVAALSHPEQALFMVGVAGIVRIPLSRMPAVGIPPAGNTSGQVDSPQDRGTQVPTAADMGTLGIALGGVLLGRLMTEVYLKASDMEILNPRTGYLDFGLSRFIEHHNAQPLGLLWTLWGPIWLAFVAIVVAHYLLGREPDADPAQTRARNGLWAAVVGLGFVALVPVVVTLDETRVYAVITAPLLGALALGIGTWSTLPRRWLSTASVALLAMTAILPGGFATGVTSWRHQLHTVEMVEFLATGDLPEGTSDMTAWLLEPFSFVIPELDE